jgi:hypothetical protein
MDGIDQEAGEIKAFGVAELIQEEVMDAVPDTGKIPVPQPTPTGHATATAHLLRQVLPRDARFQDEKDPREGFAISQGRTPSLGPRRSWGEQGLDQLPEFVRQQGLGHENTLPPRR